MSNKRVFETNAEHVYPVESPDLSLDFINSRGIDPAYTFTRNSAATYVGPDGLIKTAAVNQPRFDYDPVTGDVKGLLVEESRTNLLTYSTTFNVAWTDNTNITRNTTTALAPDGTDSALRVTAGNGNATIIRNSAVGSTTTRTFSIYLRRVSGSGLIQFTWNGGSSWVTITQSITNTWSRFILFTNTTNHRVGLRIVTAGDSIELWGAQLEVGSLSSYIPTTTTTVTRQPDQLVLNKTLNTQGTLYVESRPTTGVSLVADNGSSLLSVPQETNQYSKSVLYYNTDRTLRMSSDGGLPVDSSGFFAPQDLNRVSLGFNRLNNSSYINGHLKKFSYYSSPLTEDNLRALTGNKRAVTRFNIDDIVTSGLVLYLDAASYPGTGTTWFDLSGNGNNGTLLNGVGYNSGNGGSLVFDGVNDRVTASASNIFNNFSYDIWCLPEATHQIESQSTSTTGGTSGQRYVIGPQFVASPNAGSGISVGTNGISVYEHSAAYMPPLLAHSVTINSPAHIVVNYTNKVPSLYLNGSFIKNGLTSPRTNVKITTDLIGAYPNYGVFSGKIYSAKFYNRALTAQEIQQNFNALRGRFGI